MAIVRKAFAVGNIESKVVSLEGCWLFVEVNEDDKGNGSLDGDSDIGIGRHWHLKSPTPYHHTLIAREDQSISTIQDDPVWCDLKVRSLWPVDENGDGPEVCALFLMTIWRCWGSNKLSIHSYTSKAKKKTEVRKVKSILQLKASVTVWVQAASPRAHGKRTDLSNGSYILIDIRIWEVGASWREQVTWEYLVPPYCFCDSLLPVSHDISSLCPILPLPWFFASLWAENWWSQVMNSDIRTQNKDPRCHTFCHWYRKPLIVSNECPSTFLVSVSITKTAVWTTAMGHLVAADWVSECMNIGRKT